MQSQKQIYEWRGDKPILWLAAYPKTGSTWIRTILQDIIDPAARDGARIPSVQKSKPPKDARFYDIRGTQTHVFRTHCDAFSPRLKIYAGHCVGAIGIVRHPIDIFLSALNYAFARDEADHFIDQKPKSVEQIIVDGEIEHYAAQFVSSGGIETFKHVTGPLIDHFNGWHTHMKASNLPFLGLRYEEVVQDTHTAIISLLEFLGRPAQAEHAAKIRDVADRKTAQDGTFFWKRRSYNFQKMLSSDETALVETLFSSLISALGYEFTSDQFTVQAVASTSPALP